MVVELWFEWWFERWLSGGLLVVWTEKRRNDQI